MNTILSILAKPTTGVDAFRPIDEYAKDVLNQDVTTKVCMYIQPYIIRAVKLTSKS